LIEEGLKMFFSKSKLKIRDYCYKKYDFIFSENGKKFLDNLIAEGGLSLDEAVKEIYYQNFIAAYFELAEIAFSRTLSRDLRYEAMDICSEYLNEKWLRFSQKESQLRTRVIVKNIFTEFFTEFLRLSLKI
jgi:hypothetical protein